MLVKLSYTLQRVEAVVRFLDRIFAFVVKVVKPLVQFPSLNIALQIKYSAANHHVTCAIFGVCWFLLAAMTPLKAP